MIPEARACSYQLHTTRPYLTNRTYRENAETLHLHLRPAVLSGLDRPRIPVAQEWVTTNRVSSFR
jgi:hypothetical protein